MKKLVSIIGNGNAVKDSKEYNMAFELGKLLVTKNFRIVTGGKGGIMEAACKGAHSSDNYSEGDTIGILPGLQRNEANQYVDIALTTGMGIARNVLVASSQAIIAIGGGAGTLSEIAIAWQLGRPVLAWQDSSYGWSGKLAHQNLDEIYQQNQKEVTGFHSAHEAIILLESLLC